MTRGLAVVDVVRSYSELRHIRAFADRFEYLSLKGVVGEATFGFERYLNQGFYASSEWRRARRDVIARDLGCDLGIDGYEIHDRIYVHHMNPMTVDDIVHSRSHILDPEFLICVTHGTHNAIHYGDARLLPKGPIIRRPGDTVPWRK